MRGVSTLGLPNEVPPYHHRDLPSSKVLCSVANMVAVAGVRVEEATNSSCHDHGVALNRERIPRCAHDFFSEGRQEVGLSM
jgi:hypothetical protein